MTYRGLRLSRTVGAFCSQLGVSLIIAVAYPEPVGGSYGTFGLSKTWMTASGRYGPYGFRSSTITNTETAVEWYNIDWASVQDNCLARNYSYYPQAKNITNHPTITLPTWTWRQPFGLQKSNRPPKDITQATGRTAIVIRTWIIY